MSQQTSQNQREPPCTDAKKHDKIKEVPSPGIYKIQNLPTPISRRAGTRKKKGGVAYRVLKSTTVEVRSRVEVAIRLHAVGRVHRGVLVTMVAECLRPQYNGMTYFVRGRG
jgi:hypothetical protein